MLNKIAARVATGEFVGLGLMARHVDGSLIVLTDGGDFTAGFATEEDLALPPPPTCEPS